MEDSRIEYEADFNKQPEYYISENGVIVTLFNRNYDTQNDTQNDTQKLTINERHGEIIRLIENNPNITAEELKDILNLSKSTIRRDITKLRDEGRLQYCGSSKKGYWIIKKN